MADEDIEGLLSALEQDFKHDDVVADNRHLTISPDEDMEEEWPGKGEDKVDYTEKVDEYLLMLQHFCDVLSKIDGGYKGKLEAYIKKRNEESQLYRETAAPRKIGANCNTADVNRHTSRQRWKATTVIKGPAWKREIERRPKIFIRGLTEAEAKIVNKNRENRVLWNKIL